MASKQVRPHRRDALRHRTTPSSRSSGISDVACEDANALRHRLQNGHGLALADGRTRTCALASKPGTSVLATHPRTSTLRAHAKCGDSGSRSAIDFTVASDCQSCRQTSITIGYLRPGVEQRRFPGDRQCPMKTTHRRLGVLNHRRTGTDCIWHDDDAGAWGRCPATDLPTCYPAQSLYSLQSRTNE